MNVQSLLRPGGDPWKLVPYALLVSFVGSAGQLVIPVQFKDYIWAASVVGNAAYTPLLILALTHLFAAALGPRVHAGVVLGLGIVTGCLAGTVLGIEIYQLMAGPETTPGKGYLYQLGFVRGPLLWWGLVGAAWYMLKRAEHRADELVTARAAADRLRAGTAEARLAALQAQVEPHFLFNTLANVQHLVETDTGAASRMLASLIKYLRAALPQMREATTTLGREVEMAVAFLDIHRIRMGTRLEFAIDVPENLKCRPFPPMMLISLVENAIKHGVDPCCECGTITIRAQEAGGRLRVCVADTGEGIKPKKGGGVGLSNIRERLKALYGGTARLVLEENPPHGVVASIEMPAEVPAAVAA